MAPINPSQLPVPYVPPNLFPKSFGGREKQPLNLLWGHLGFLAGAEYLTREAPLGDGTLAGAYGLTDDEFQPNLAVYATGGLKFPYRLCRVC